MELLELLVLALLGAAVWLWLDSLKAREIGVTAAQVACADEGLQFLDDAVDAPRSIRRRYAKDRLRDVLLYSFLYSDTGDNRRPGTVTLLGQRVELLHVRPQLYVVPKAPETHETLH